MKPEATSAIDVIQEHKGNSILPEVLERRLGITRWEAIAALKELADSGHGSFILGRKGHSTRFEKADMNPDNSEKSDVNATLLEQTIANEQVFLLTREKPIYIRVPANLTAVEASRLCKWLHVISTDDT